MIAGVESALPENSKVMKALIDKLGDEGAHGEMQILEGDALEAIAEMANKEENKLKWRREKGKELMLAIVGENGRKKWVMKEFEEVYWSTVPC